MEIEKRFKNSNFVGLCLNISFEKIKDTIIKLVLDTRAHDIAVSWGYYTVGNEHCINVLVVVFAEDADSLKNELLENGFVVNAYSMAL